MGTGALLPPRCLPPAPPRARPVAAAARCLREVTAWGLQVPGEGTEEPPALACPRGVSSPSHSRCCAGWSRASCCRVSFVPAAAWGWI